jgi:hypothetical protein
MLLFDWSSDYSEGTVVTVPWFCGDVTGEHPWGDGFEFPFLPEPRFDKE